MDKNKYSLIKRSIPVFYKLSLEVLFLVVISTLGYVVVEFLLPGLLERHISFFSVYGVLIVSMLIVVVLGMFSGVRTLSSPLRESDILLISILSSLWIVLSFDSTSFSLQVFVFFLLFVSVFSMVSFLLSQDMSHE